MNYKIFRLNRATTAYLGSLIGLMSYLLVVGIERLNPSNITWLANGGWGDSLWHYYGWVSFRNSPWELPLGINSSYGINYLNSVVYTDSVPILAIPFKLLSPLLPPIFQYFGFWILICFVLQGFAAWKLVSLFSDSIPILASGTSLFTFMPIMLNRINTHLSLVGQFTILFGLYFCLRKESSKHFRDWTFLLIVTSGIHTYLLSMNLLLFIADSYKRLKSKETLLFRDFFELLGVLALLSISMWQFGWFVAGNRLTTVFPSSLFKMDLLQPFNLSGWSMIFSKVLPNPLGNFEGFNYLGLGTLLLLPILLVLHSKNKLLCAPKIREYWALTVVLLSCFIFSLSNEVTIGKKKLLQFDYPPIVELIPGVLRAVGRFFWLPAIFLFLVVIYLVTKSFSTRFAAVIMTLVAFLQVVDSSYAWRRIQSLTNLPVGYNIPTYDKQKWYKIRLDYENIRVKPTIDPEISCDWRRIGYIATELRFRTNCAKSARINRKELWIDYEAFKFEINSGNLISKSVYVLDEKTFEALVSSGINDRYSWFVDEGYIVLLPKQ